MSVKLILVILSVLCAGACGHALNPASGGAAVDQSWGEDFIIEGRVIDSAGKPVEGTIVTHGLIKSTTERHGRYRFMIERSRFTQSESLIARHKGYAPAWRSERPPGPDEKSRKVDFTLKKGHWLEILAVDLNGKAIANVEVKSYNEILRNPDGHYWQTDRTGHLRIDDLPPGELRLELSHEGFLTRTLVTDVDYRIELPFWPARSLNGRVMDAETRQPIEKFAVYALSAPAYFNLAAPSRHEQGRFQIHTLQRDHLEELAIEAEGYAPLFQFQTKLGEPGKAVEKEFYLRRGRPITGVVVDAETSAPLKQAHIGSGFVHIPEHQNQYNLDPGAIRLMTTKITDQDGRFSINGDAVPDSKLSLLEAGRTLLIHTGSHANLIIRPADRASYLRADGSLCIPLSRAASISGVYTPHGRPKAYKRLCLSGENSGWIGNYGWIETDAFGAFRWDCLLPGRYAIWGDGFNYVVTLASGEHKILNLGSAMGSIVLSGRVTVNGKPRPDTPLIFHLDPETPSGSRKMGYVSYSVKTDVEGRYQIENLSPAKYQLEFGHSGGGDRPLFLPDLIDITVSGRRDFNFNEK